MSAAAAMIEFDTPENEGFCVFLVASGALSILGGLTFVFLFAKHSELRRHPGSILLFCAISDISYSAYFVRTARVPPFDPLFLP